MNLQLRDEITDIVAALFVTVQNHNPLDDDDRLKVKSCGVFQLPVSLRILQQQLRAYL